MPDITSLVSYFYIIAWGVGFLCLTGAFKQAKRSKL